MKKHRPQYYDTVSRRNGFYHFDKIVFPIGDKPNKFLNLI